MSEGTGPQRLTVDSAVGLTIIALISTDVMQYDDGGPICKNSHNHRQSLRLIVVLYFKTLFSNNLL